MFHDTARKLIENDVLGVYVLDSSVAPNDNGVAFSFVIDQSRSNRLFQGLLNLTSIGEPFPECARTLRLILAHLLPPP